MKFITCHNGRDLGKMMMVKARDCWRINDTEGRDFPTRDASVRKGSCRQTVVTNRPVQIPDRD